MCIDIDPTRQSASHSWSATHSPHTNAHHTQSLQLCNNVPQYQCTKVPMYQSKHVPMHQCNNVIMKQGTNAPHPHNHCITLHCTNAPVLVHCRAMQQHKVQCEWCIECCSIQCASIGYKVCVQHMDGAQAGKQQTDCHPATHDTLGCKTIAHNYVQPNVHKKTQHIARHCQKLKQDECTIGADKTRKHKRAQLHSQEEMEKRVLADWLVWPGCCCCS